MYLLVTNYFRKYLILKKIKSYPLKKGNINIENLTFSKTKLFKYLSFLFFYFSTVLFNTALIITPHCYLFRSNKNFLENHENSKNKMKYKEKRNIKTFSIDKRLEQFSNIKTANKTIRKRQTFSPKKKNFSLFYLKLNMKQIK